MVARNIALYDNIQVIPLKGALEPALRGEVLIALGDNISTDHIMPAGAQMLRFRSNIPKLADYVFNRVDPEFVARAKAKKGGFIVGGSNYGQGSSREHAAIAPMYLGIVGVIVKDFARIHLANLINWGILPMTFADPADHGRVRQGDVLEISDVRRLVEGGASSLVVKNVTQGTTFKVALSLNRRERAYVEAADSSDPEGPSTIHQQAQAIVADGRAPPLGTVVGARFSTVSGARAYVLAGGKLAHTKAQPLH